MSPLPSHPLLNTAGVPLCHVPLSPTVPPCPHQLTPAGLLGTPWGPVPSLPLTPTCGRWEAASTPLPSPARLSSRHSNFLRKVRRQGLPSLFSTENVALYSTSDDEHCGCVCFKDIYLIAPFPSLLVASPHLRSV